MTSNLMGSKANLRKLMKNVLKQINIDEKQRQSNIVVNYLLNNSEKFANAKHIALYLAMKDQEIDTIPLIETLLKQQPKKTSLCASCGNEFKL